MHTFLFLREKKMGIVLACLVGDNGENATFARHGGQRRLSTALRLRL